MSKKIYLILVFLIVVTASQAQITVNFTGHYLNSTVDLAKVTVENLSNGERVVLESGFAVDLVSEYTAIESVSDLKSACYPNPFVNSTTLTVPSSVSGNFAVSVCDISGKVILNQEFRSSQNTNSIKFTAARSGVFFVKITSDKNAFKSKLVCKAAQASDFKLEMSENALSLNSYEKSKQNPQLLYTVGDMLIYTGEYDVHKRVETASPTQNVTTDLIFQACIDYELNSYAVIKVGTQWWMAENLRSKKYANGSAISGSNSCENNAENDVVYGRLYTWNATMHGSAGNNNVPSGEQGVCPTGWHVPSEMEWDNMRDALGGQAVMGGKLKETGFEHWLAPNTGATNSSGMTILPGGMRWGDDGANQYFGEGAFFWNASDFEDLEYASGYNFTNESESATYVWNRKINGQSVRCVKN